MKIGIVCPYSFDVPGGVQGHVIDLAKALLARGHQVSVLAPADEDSDVPDFVVPAGKALGIPYNGSVARLQFGPVSYARVRRWIRDGDFDVLHLHEPAAPSLSLLALKVADGPIVATFHTATTRSRTLAAFQPVLRPLLEKITARIAVSALARRVQVEHAGGDAVEVPNGVDVDFFSRALPLDGYPRAGGTVGFVGRYTEPRKGMGVLLEALRMLLPEFEELRLLVVGRGDADQLRREAGPELAPHIDLLGQVDDETKARALRSVDVYCAPNTGGESFGMILTEAMAAGTPVLASGLDSFRRVLDDGKAGMLTETGDAAALADGLRELLGDPARRASLAAAAGERVAMFDWSVVTTQVLRVYETAIAADPRRVGAGEREFSR
ncbi:MULTISPECIES: glycosyltransferase family 4 protein [Amycolatopsis]|uniref:glycosyltransferase family 4 protein n=1 Tax=Amycolatopsis TaxID=1813 RepID=UPI000907C811|nr:MULTISPECIES: glycosyltransferase family 4 protein [Amycolatopsis]OKK01905.1 alpha-(1-2)-phosphatidylinositol mannosyltransferase [Amycolatopsis sp. CB00013]OLZ46009.1 alpha-(1-2)-phosphatidylinositol mannosyltransferase [Amycolatopsis keratiniphila subsp. nogabecina]RSN42286.1 glycosyltransferase family 1 protein [Amycolatopsis sp. WAC 04197]UMP07207.1 glycosyltransferase family 4 protein [Amycolatopsis sp. EV170708-02-1]